jgi:riboflavin kinase / FMN adenylyltransferase
MKVHYDIQNLPVFKNAVLTIGTFDGVHTGHQLIIKQLISEAYSIDGESIVITFHPHPKTIVVGNKQDIKVLNTLDEKINLLQKLGVKHLVVVAFDSAFASQTATEYINNFLVAKFNPSIIIVGYDHRFGADRMGDYHLLQQSGLQNNFTVKEIPEHILQNVIISSTKIRNALLTGDVDTAKNFLGYKYFFSGSVVQGNKLGRTIGFPTANLLVMDHAKLIPAFGVYSVEVFIPNYPIDIKNYKGMMNIGIKPTLGGNEISIEINIFDFNIDIYDEVLTITIKKKLRNEIKFDGLDSLKLQLTQDKIDSQKSFTE